MNAQPVNNTINSLLTERLKQLEANLDADILTYYGPIADESERLILKIIEELKEEPDKKETLYVILTTLGGSAIAVERYANILRKHYSEVNFIVPDYAYSAGTIFCMSGDNIFMDYSSVLGPIDPQVQNKDGKWVAALGYLDKVQELIQKAQNDELSKAEFLILKDFDLAELRGYEQAKEHTIDLLKKWLVKYKFKNWETVTLEQKEARAEEIAQKLSDNKVWKSHGRPINLEILSTFLRLEIEDYSDNETLRVLIRSYYDLLVDYISKLGFSIFVHTKKFI